MECLKNKKCTFTSCIFLRRRSAATYMAGSLKTVAHAILSPCGLCMYLYMYGCGCTHWVTLREFSWGSLQQQHHVYSYWSGWVFLLMKRDLLPHLLRKPNIHNNNTKVNIWHLWFSPSWYNQSNAMTSVQQPIWACCSNLIYCVFRAGSIR